MAERKYRVLVADSNTACRERTISALAAVGFECESATDGERALDLLAAAPFDVLVTDLVLPGVHGHSVIVQAQQRVDPPRLVVLTDFCDPRLVRDLLARGIDDYLHKSIPGELLSTKLLSLFEIDKWRTHQRAAESTTDDTGQAGALAAIERHLQVVTMHFADKLAPLFDMDYAMPGPPPALVEFASRLAIEQRGYPEADLADAGNVRATARVVFTATATAIQVDPRYQATDSPASVMIRDLSATGVRLLHTRAIPATNLVLAWEAETIPHYTFRVPLSIKRCLPEGRFYDIGGQFDVPEDLTQSSNVLAAQRLAVTS